MTKTTSTAKLLSWAITSISPTKVDAPAIAVAARIATQGVLLREWIVLSTFGRVPVSAMPYISREEVICNNSTVLAVAIRAATAMALDTLGPGSDCRNVS